MPLSSHAASEFFETGPFDVGRAQTNQSVDGPRADIPGWWNGEAGDVHCNVGWNSSGIWWSYILFGAPQTQADTKTNLNPEIFQKIEAADEIYLHLGVAWTEVDPQAQQLFGAKSGVVVTAYLVPRLQVPPDNLGSWDHTWISGTPANPGVSVNNYDPIEMFDIDPEVYPPLATNGTEYRVGLGFPPQGPSEEEKRNHLTRFNITSFVKSAIAQGKLDESTPWGIALYTKEAEPLTAFDAKWSSARQTIIDGDLIILETVVSEKEFWADYEVDANGNVNTGTFLGWLNVSAGDWVWFYSLGRYVYLPEGQVEAGGAWVHFPR